MSNPNLKNALSREFIKYRERDITEVLLKKVVQEWPCRVGEKRKPGGEDASSGGQGGDVSLLKEAGSKKMKPADVDSEVGVPHAVLGQKSDPPSVFHPEKRQQKRQGQRDGNHTSAKKSRRAEGIDAVSKGRKEATSLKEDEMPLEEDPEKEAREILPSANLDIMENEETVPCSLMEARRGMARLDEVRSMPHRIPHCL